MYRQGDLLIVPHESSISSNAKLVPDGVVQLGEATGHAHVLKDGKVYRDSWGAASVLESDGEARLVHEEHETITLPEGTYRVLRQREFQPEGDWAHVSD